MTTITPPQPPPAAAEAPLPPVDGRAPGARVVSLIAMVIGAVVVVGTVSTASIGAIAAAVQQTETRTVDVRGINGVDVNVSASRVSIQFGDVDEATLRITGGRGADRWTFRRDSDELVVSAPDRPLGIGWILGGDDEATITLPQTLADAALDAHFTVTAGELDASGSYGGLDLEVSAGSAEISGSAADLSVEVGAGSADLDVESTVEADLSVSAGTLVAHLEGAAPRLVNVSVEAGSLELTVPDETYDVGVVASAGELDNSLETSTTADRRIVGDVSAGAVVLRSGD